MSDGFGTCKGLRCDCPDYVPGVSKVPGCGGVCAREGCEHCRETHLRTKRAKPEREPR